MPTTAKLYIGVTVALGFSLLAGCLALEPQFPELPRYLSYILLAALASTLKVRLPGFTGTISLNFFFILIGIADFTLAETLVMGCTAVLIQCIWRTRRKPNLVQLMFNVAALALSVAVAYQVSHFVVLRAHAEALPALMVIAACVYFVSNTILISTVLALVESKSLRSVWQQCYLWSFPYYLVGSAIAGLVTLSSRTIGWQPALLLLPMMYLVYVFYKLYLKRAAQSAEDVVAETA